MEIGIIMDNHGYERFGDEKYKKMKEHGYSCADYNMADTFSGVYVASETDAMSMMLREKELSEKAGIRISQVHGPWTGKLPERTPEGLCELLEDCKKSIRYTSMLSCKNWVIHPLLPCGGDEIDTPDAQKTWDINLAFFKELVKTAEECDVIICLENMPFLNYSMSKPKRILELVNAVDNDYFRICLDTGHVATFSELSLGDEIRALADKIQTFHIHDTIYEKDIHLFPYYGVIDWADFIKAVRDIGYDGVFSLETQPSRKLPLPIFEEMSRTLIKIAKEIISCL